MKFRMMCVVTGLVTCLLPFMMGQGCQPPADGGGTDGTDVGTDDLTSLENKAIIAGCNAPGALAQAADVSQNATGDLGSGGSQQSVPQDKDATFGTCPEVTKDGSLGSGVDLTIDFGQTPCTALSVQQEDGSLYTYTCSGSASGSFSLASQSMSLTFSNLSCNDQALDGSASLSYSLLVPGVQLEGTWNLSWYPGTEAIGTSGTGTVSYVPVTGGCCDVTHIEEFAGNVTEGEYEWSAAMTNIRVSLEKYYSFIPYSGSMTIDGPDIRALTITFNENSPTTGEITVSLENGRSVTVSLYELEEWAEIVLGE